MSLPLSPAPASSHLAYRVCALDGKLLVEVAPGILMHLDELPTMPADLPQPLPQTA